MGENDSSDAASSSTYEDSEFEREQMLRDLRSMDDTERLWRLHQEQAHSDYTPSTPARSFIHVELIAHINEVCRRPGCRDQIWEWIQGYLCKEDFVMMLGE